MFARQAGRLQVGGLAIFCVLGLVASPLHSEAKRETGELKVKVRALGLHAPAKIKVQMDPQVCGITRAPKTVVLGSRGELANTLVWLEGKSLTGWNLEGLEAGSAYATVKISNCEAQPRVLVIPPGQSVAFQSTDKIGYFLRPQGKLNRASGRSLSPDQIEIQFRFEKPEVIPVRCDLHEWFQSFVVVAPHPFYAATNENGEVRFPRLPPGRYTVNLWHEVLGTTSLQQEVEVLSKSKEVSFEWEFKP